MTEEYIASLRQAFNIGVWLQLNTILNVIICLNGIDDNLTLHISHSNEVLIDFKLESFSKKSKERISLELNRLITHLLELKNTEFYQR